MKKVTPMTEPLLNIPNQFMPEQPVRNPQCLNSAGYNKLLPSTETSYRHIRDGFLKYSICLGIKNNLLKILDYYFEKLTAAKAVYIFFKIYIPTAVTVVRNATQQRKKICQI